MHERKSLDLDDISQTSLDKSKPCTIESDDSKHASTIRSIATSFFTRARYLRLGGSQTKPPRTHNNRRRWTHMLWLAAAAASAAAGGAAGYATAATTDHSRHSPPRASLGSCGRTSEANRGNHCVYDFVMGSWIHSRCRDEELYAKYIEQERKMNLTYYADPEGTIEVSLDVALRGDHPELWTSGVQHHLHCTYFWEKQLMAWKHGGNAWDTDTLSEEHTMHCISLNGHPSPGELMNRTVTKVYAPDKPIECIVV